MLAIAKMVAFGDNMLIISWSDITKTKLTDHLSILLIYKQTTNFRQMESFVNLYIVESYK